MGMSLAFGAFLAGLMISDSEYSQNAFGNLIPFKDTFSSFFFVSIGMLLNLQFVMDNFLLVCLTVTIVIVIKTIIAGGTAFVLGHTFRGTVMAGIALSQVGEFSFILAKLDLENRLIVYIAYPYSGSQAVCKHAVKASLTKNYGRRPFSITTN
jgi:CPA2 family monovalent cation:H+ antiporter-2